MKTLTFNSEPRGESYRLLLRGVRKLSARALLVVRPRTKLDEDGVRLLKELSGHLLEKTERDSWPGTQLLDEKADVYEYAVDDLFIEKLARGVTGLFEWIHPHAPEDLCFLREDGTTLLGSISHEADAWLQVDDAEADQILSERVVRELFT